MCNRQSSPLKRVKASQPKFPLSGGGNPPIHPFILPSPCLQHLLEGTGSRMEDIIETPAWPTAPEYDWGKTPRQLSSFECDQTSAERHNFFRSARWYVHPQTHVHSSWIFSDLVLTSRCHDGSSILATAEDRALRVYDWYESPPRPLPSADCTSSVTEDGVDIGPSKSFPQPDAINKATWYPSASRTSPVTFCFMTSVRDTPVRLIDASDGRVSLARPSREPSGMSS